MDPARLRLSQLEPRTAAKTVAPRRQRPTFALTPELPFRTALTPLLERSGCGPLPPRSAPVRSHSLPFVRRCPILGRVRSRIRFVEATPGGRLGATTRWSCSCWHRRSIGRTHHAAPTIREIQEGRSPTFSSGAPLSRSPCPGTGGHQRPGAMLSPAGWVCSLRNWLSPPSRGGIGRGSDGEGDRWRPQDATAPRREVETQATPVRGAPITYLG